MYRFMLVPRWMALHAVVLLVIPAFIVLGNWQFGRYEERSAKAAQAQRNLAAAPVPLASLTGPGRSVPGVLLRRPVTVAGRYDPSHEQLVRRRTQNGRLGYYVLTPLVTSDGSGALVNRGWVPAGRTADEVPTVPSPPPGDVWVTGRLRGSETEKSTGIRDRPGLPAGQVLLIDVPAIARGLPYPIASGYVELTAPVDDQAPVPVPPPDLGGGGGLNLAYAVQWWVFAVIAVGGWFFLMRKEARDQPRDAEISES